jgi:hypothetical protein
MAKQAPQDAQWTRVARRLLLCAAVAGALAACGFEPMPVPDSSGMKPGPGLLTGKSGEFVIRGPR